MNRVIALAWAVEPLAFKSFLPAQSELAELDPPPELADALLSLPHADISRARASRLAAATPGRLSFTEIPPRPTGAETPTRSLTPDTSVAAPGRHESRR